MNYVVDSICLLNSSFSKDKIIKLFKSIMFKGGIDEFILLSNIVQVVTTHSLKDGYEILLECGNYGVSFKYKSNSSRCLLDERDLEHLIAVFIASIENSILYNDITNKIEYGKNKTYPSYNDLIEDISKEIKHYDRFGINFCVSKITFDSKSPEYIKKLINEITGLIRATDSVYLDSKNIYILFRNTVTEDGEVIINKLKSVAKNELIGIAEWRGDYVIVDLISEIENYIFLSNRDKEIKTSSIVDDLNIILNRALYRNETIIIVPAEEVSDNLISHVVLSFKHEGINYHALKNYKNLSEFNYCYKFIGDEVAEDILSELGKRD